MNTQIIDKTIISWYLLRFPEKRINFNNSDDYFWTWRQRFSQGIETAISYMDSTSREVLKKVLFNLD